MQIEGRMPGNLMHEWIVLMTGPIIRVDESNRPVFWLQITLTATEVAEMYDFYKEQGAYNEGIFDSNDPSGKGMG